MNIKIINDKDVKISRKEESLKRIQTDCIDMIDLSFDKPDLDEIENDGVVSLERGYTEGVMESIILFAELLGYTDAPKSFKVNHCRLFGVLQKKENNEKLEELKNLNFPTRIFPLEKLEVETKKFINSLFFL